VSAMSERISRKLEGWGQALSTTFLGGRCFNQRLLRRLLHLLALVCGRLGRTEGRTIADFRGVLESDLVWLAVNPNLFTSALSAHAACKPRDMAEHGREVMLNPQHREPCMRVTPYGLRHCSCAATTSLTYTLIVGMVAWKRLLRATK
jgi:hypothetical protein